MVRYKNLGGNSGVSAYEIGAEQINVQFSSGAVYLYTYKSAGSSNIEEMKSLAVAGKGLNSFIMRNVRKDFETKIR